MLTVSHITKRFGDLVVVDNVSFSIPKGHIMGLIGQNGSGKTTIFRMILGFLTPEDQGKVLWKDQPLTQEDYNTIGYLPEERGLDDKLTIEQQVLYLAQLRGMEKAVIQERLDQWMKRFNVKGEKTDKIRSLSKGNQQKVQLMASLIHEPSLIILDEPFSGLDPVNADLLKAGILYLKEKGSSIIFSSHNMANVEELCDSLVMIHYGKEILNGTIEEVRNSYGRVNLTIESPNWTEESLSLLEGVQSVQSKGNHQYLLKLEDEDYAKQVFERITEGQYIPVFNQQAPSLEEIFKYEAGGHPHE